MSTAPPPALRLHTIAKRYAAQALPSVAAIDGVSLELARGQLLALLGPSGCGKTTTLRLIGGFERLDAGRIEIDGQIVDDGDRYIPPERRRIGMVFQEYALFPHLDVAHNIGFGLRGEKGEKARRVEEALALVGMTGLGGRMPHELSGGQQQRVALARALAPNPALILLDEPFSNLDAGLRLRVRSEVRAILQEAGATAVFVTHDQEEALSLADQVAVLIGGQLRQMATPQDLYRAPADRAVAAFVGRANFLPGTAEGGRVVCELGALELQGAITGAVELLLRPEAIHLMPAGSESAPAEGRVRRVLFFGHDQLITVELGSGRTVEARLGPACRFAPGERVIVAATGPVMAYPAHSSEEAGAVYTSGHTSNKQRGFSSHDKPLEKG